MSCTVTIIKDGKFDKAHLEAGPGIAITENADDIIITNTGAGGSPSWGALQGTLADQTDLQAALNAKTSTAQASAAAPVQSVAGRTGTVVLAKADVGLGSVDNTTDAAKPVSNATLTALNAKQATSEKGVANGYASLGADGRVPSGQLPLVSDAWAYLRLAADFSTSSATAVDITGMGFTPAANGRYEFEAELMLRTATATVNPRVGLAWPTGMTDGVASIEEAQTAATSLPAKGNINAALLVAVGGLPNTNQSWPCSVWGIAIATASPSGQVRLQLASETAGTNVTVKAGSYLKYRTIP